MRRRKFAGSLAFALLIAGSARSQAGRTARIGFLANASLADGLEAFVGEMAKLGYVEGRNLALDRRLVDTAERNAELAESLLLGNPDLLMGAGTQQIEALQRVAGRIPVVFVNTADPVGLGLVTSLTRPGGNTTGIANYIVELSQKRLELVIEAKPDVSRIAILFNPANAVSVAALRQTDAAAQALGRKIIAVPAQTPDELASALQLLGREQPGALLAGGADVMIGSRSASVAQFALERRLATMFTMPRDARAGGLMAYGTDPTESYRRAAALVDRILKGAKPADLPVEQPTKFELVINLRTAKAIGFSVPPALLSRADEVIE